MDKTTGTEWYILMDSLVTVLSFFSVYYVLTLLPYCLDVFPDVVTINADIFAHQDPGGIFVWFNFRACSILFYLFFYNSSFHSHQTLVHIKPCAKCENM